MGKTTKQTTLRPDYEEDDDDEDEEDDPHGEFIELGDMIP